MVDLTTYERRLLRKLAMGPPGQWIVRRHLRASVETLQHLHHLALVEGAGSQDAKGWGMTPDSSHWRLTAKGREAINARP